MKSKTLCETDPSLDWAARYEELRTHILDKELNIVSSTWGLILFLRRGLAGWIAGWSDPEAYEHYQRSSTPAWSDPAARPFPNEITPVLVDMLMHLFEEKAS